MSKAKPPKDRKCKTDNCNKLSAPGKTLCWACSKREYRARKKLKSMYDDYVGKCRKLDIDPMIFDLWQEYKLSEL